MRHHQRRLAAHRKPEQSAGRDDQCTELPLGTCYVGVGGYGTIEIRVLHDGAIGGKSVRLALPCRNDGTGEGEAIVQPSDTLVIHGAQGEITRIPVQEVIERESLAGFRLLVHDQLVEAAEASARDALDELEQYLAGVSARELNKKERLERDTA